MKGWRKDEAKVREGDVVRVLGEYWSDCFRQVKEQVEAESGSDLQRSGVDRRLICEDGHEILVEEKVRFRAFDRYMLLEESHISTEGKHPPRTGWINRELRCHVLGCLWLYRGQSRFVAFDYPRLRSIYLGRRKDPWREISTTKNNNGYRTVSKLVPLSVLSDAIIYTAEGRK